MYCPTCSTKVSLDQKFCRSCGLGLEKIAQSVSDQHPSELTRNLEVQENKQERLGMIAWSIFGIGVSGFFFYMVHGWFQGYGTVRTTKLLALLALLVVFGCGLMSVLLFAKAKDLHATSTKRHLQHPEQFPEPAGTAKFLLKKDVEPIPSVTERTTELLFTEKKKQK